MATQTYKEAGVDIEAGERLVERIRPQVKKTLIPEALEDFGGFAALCNLPTEIREPVLVSSTDGVGTKLKIAFLADNHTTVGIDLVAMCVNDIITCGARPLFFLDYLASSKLDVDRASTIIEGIAKGCIEAGCALLGGETAELPGMYLQNEYDLAGFAVGVADKPQIVTGKRINSGDIVIGIASNGIHSNGYSLARKILLEQANLHLNARQDELGEPLVDTLLRPTRIYVRAIQCALEKGGITGLCHITGGGLPGNIPRILPDGLGVELHKNAWQVPAIFDLISQLGNIEPFEMYRTFNMGLGFIIIVERNAADTVRDVLVESGESAYQVGVVYDMADSATDERVHFI